GLPYKLGLLAAAFSGILVGVLLEPGRTTAVEETA
ncbi:branched-chain amino acid ABC transporter permease, partial [Pseudomonas sp. CrR25]|nr:branched-chain amino acid ABC transporter permease [Pseudomonas sp. CrR25]